MSAPHQYHQPNAPDPAEDDGDSDLDLDLHELDPATGGTNSSPRPSRETSRGLPDVSSRIPLRNLRIGRLRGNRGYGRHNRSQNALDEDLSELLGDDHDPKRDSTGSGLAEDDAPLLPTAYGRRRPKQEEGKLRRLGSTMRLPSFMSSASRLSTSQDRPEEQEAEEDEHDPSTNRAVAVGSRQTARFPPNAVSNAKYTPWSFLPRTLYNEFSFFLNMYFLLVALSQIIPVLRIGYLSTYVAPLAFVITVTLGKEAMDDIGRRRRDAEANSEAYTILKFDDGAAPNESAKKKDGAKHSQRRAKGKAKRAVNGVRLDDIEEEERGIDQALGGRPTARVSEVVKRSSELKVGDVLKLGKDQRVPADVVILKSVSNEQATTPIVADPVLGSSAAVDETENLIDADGEVAGPISQSVQHGSAAAQEEPTGEAFIRTDQLDGETDWKLRLALPLTQTLDLSEFTRLRVVAGKPDKKVNDFVGTIEVTPRSSKAYDPPVDSTASAGEPNTEAPAADQTKSAPLTIDNTAWANTVLASTSTVLAVIIYTGPQTRQALSTSASRSKTGLLELEINSLTKILCTLTLSLSFILVALQGFEPEENTKWYISVMKYLILFSTVVPISLRVNLDMGKSVYAWFIEHDQDIAGTVVRTSTIPEDLGRIEYLLSDKTGTLTQNEMELKKIHVGTVSYANEAMEEVSSYIQQAFQVTDEAPLVTASSAFVVSGTSATRTRREIGSRARDLVLALALCHNVTPTTEEENGQTITTYQASSPDEIAIVRWTEHVGLRLLHRDRNSMVLQSTQSERAVVRVRILNVFPFTSEGKRMGIVVQFSTSTNDSDREIWFYQKGADTVMTSIVAANDWLDEETANMAREGLRTLVVGRKRISVQQYEDFSQKHTQASLSLQSRDSAMADVVKQYLERDLELLGVTGVEDKLQRDVKPSLELLRNAGIKIWMLTGDKVETARCVAVSSKLVARGQYVHTIAKLKRKELAHDALSFLYNQPTACLLIDGESLALMLAHHRDTFISIAVRLPAVVACRCSPTQKADVAKLIRQYTRKRICCIGDGGNDVSMIQAADVGVGIVGKEGRQASLAADFSIDQFCYLTKLLVWHGRNSYKRSAKLAQFVIHRGLIISVCQTMYSIASRFEPNALYKDWLLVGYATIYTLAPVFSLTLDRDVDESLANLYPELYKELTSGRSLSYRTFFIWVFVSIYQGCMIQGLSQLLVGLDDFPRMVAVSYTVLVLNELFMVAAEVTTWHPVMIFSILGTAAVFFGSLPFLGGYFDLGYMVNVGFLWRTVAILAIALVPVWGGKVIGRTLRPPNYRKVRGV